MLDLTCPFCGSLNTYRDYVEGSIGTKVFLVPGLLHCNECRDGQLKKISWRASEHVDAS